MDTLFNFLLLFLFFFFSFGWNQDQKIKSYRDFGYVKIYLEFPF